MRKIKRHSYIISTPGTQDAGAKYLQQVVFELERRGVKLSKEERTLLIRRMRTTGTLVLKDANRKTLAVVIKAHHTEVRKNPGKKLSVPERHQLKIARDTMKMSDVGASIMGGPSKAEAREIIKRLTGKYPIEAKENPSKSDRKLLTDAGAYRGAKGFQPHNRSDVLAARVKLLQRAKGTPRYASLVKSFRKADK